MADTTSKSNGNTPKKPNFYETAAEMGGQSKAASGGVGGANSGAGVAEKVSNVQALLEVFKKMDKLEQDAEAKALIQQMSDIAQQYLTKIQGKGGTAAATTAPATGAGATPPPPPTDTTGAGTGAGAGVGGGGAMTTMGAGA